MKDIDPELDEFELLLRRLPLQQPSLELDARLHRTLTRRPAHQRRYTLSAFTGIGLAAAAVLLLTFLINHPAPTTTPAPSPSPLAQHATTEHWLDEGIVGYASNGPIRQYRLRTYEPLAAANAKSSYVYSEQVVQIVSQAY